MPNHSTATASLHALTERLASQSRSLHPFINSGALPPNFPSPQALAHAASAYRQPAPPPQLPAIQLAGRHQDPVISDQNHDHDSSNGNGNGNGHQPNGTGVGVVRCQEGRAWQESDRHAGERLSRFSDEEMDRFVDDMGKVLRREFDCWVEQCWQEAFHHLFTHTLPNLIIHLIMTGSTPTFLRRKVVYGGQSLDHLFQSQMLNLLYEELELRLSGGRPHAEPGPSNAASRMSPLPLPTPATATPTSLFRDGVCFHNLAYHHGIPEEEDDHGPCLCQLTTCMNCFHQAALSRRGPASLLPYELVGTSVAEGWLGNLENEEQAISRQQSLRRKATTKASLPEGKGFVHNPKPKPNTLASNGTGGGGDPIQILTKPPTIFPHPQMTDVLAVEEHLRWRLKEMGASDPAVESRYGPSTNSPAALEGIDLPDDISDDGSSVKSGSGGSGAGSKGGKIVKVAKGRGKLRRMIVNANGTVPKSHKDGNKDGKKAVNYLPKEWVNEEPSQRNTAIVLTFRHFVKLLHQISMAASPFSYPSYAKDIDELQRVHPIALYRRLTEPSVQRRNDTGELRAWQNCMDKWAEELGGKERKKGNDFINEKSYLDAVTHYTRAISLDGKKTVYYSNRAIALNNLGLHDLAEIDCKHLLSRDPKNQKALYQRALARKGMGRWREAENDLRELLKLSGDNESARNLLAVVRQQVAKQPKQRVEDVMDF
ncbi:hypothetical protein CI109_100627 [Kwoniella shandongensis]|uniref:Uncharacterized protein n=1 Tax=Kwoniella shandongensis TaxID=1734106 RepID=A0A5M6BZJ5_9TREE|nr:uncharacterized protein CI109_003451 [Kwoniella shandongensis]KAA5528163.1 hypothetical protein CI109_003451 [Kwoniella shandongensis]